MGIIHNIKIHIS